MGLLIACLLLISPRAIAHMNVGYLVADRRDDFAFISWRAFRTMEESSQATGVVLLGASSMLHGITSDADVAREIQEQTGRSTPVHDFTAGGLSLWEMASLMDLVGQRFDGVIVLGISAEQLSTPTAEIRSIKQHPKLAFRTPVFDEEVRLAGYAPERRTGNYFIDNSQFFTARIGSIRYLITGPVDYLRHTDWRNADQATWQFQIDRVSSWIREGYPAYGRANFEVIARLIARARQHGDVRIALLVTPINPRAVAELDPGANARFLADARAFAASNGVEIWELDGEAALRSQEFEDWTHLGNNDGRARYTRILARHIAELSAAAMPSESVP
jgi:hypothetical protein